MIQNTGRCGCMPFPRVLTRNMQPHPEHKHSLLIQVSMPATITPHSHIAIQENINNEYTRTKGKRQLYVCAVCICHCMFVCLYFVGRFVSTRRFVCMCMRESLHLNMPWGLLQLPKSILLKSFVMLTECPQ